MKAISRFIHHPRITAEQLRDTARDRLHESQKKRERGDALAGEFEDSGKRNHYGESFEAGFRLNDGGMK